MKRGPWRDAFNWSLVHWGYSNKSLQKLLDVAPCTIARQRVIYAPHTCPGPGRAPVGRARSGEHAPAEHVLLASACRQLIHELASGSPQPGTVREFQSLLSNLRSE